LIEYSQRFLKSNALFSGRRKYFCKIPLSVSLFQKSTLKSSGYCYQNNIDQTITKAMIKKLFLIQTFHHTTLNWAKLMESTRWLNVVPMFIKHLAKQHLEARQTHLGGNFINILLAAFFIQTCHVQIFWAFNFFVVFFGESIVN